MRFAVVALFVGALALPVAAQQYASVSPSDIQRLQENVLQAGTDLSQIGRASCRERV